MDLARGEMLAQARDTLRRARALFDDKLLDPVEAAPHFAQWFRAQAIAAAGEDRESAQHLAAAAELLDRLAGIAGGVR